MTTSVHRSSARACPPHSVRIEAEPIPDEVALRFKVRFALSADKTSIHIGNKSEGSALHPYDFFCGAWMGGESPHLEFQRLSPLPDGSAECRVNLTLLKTDVDVIKLGLYVHDPETGVNRHVVSGYQSLAWLADGLKAPDFDSSHQSMSIEDNYTSNHALLHFCNDATDLTSLRAVLPHLKRSVLHDNQAINAKVMALTFGVHDYIQRAANVSAINGGANFVKSTCFTQCMGCAIDYPLLDMTYSSERHIAPLSMLAYMGIATVHGSGHSPDALLALPDHDFMSRFVVPLTTSYTVCSRTAVYSGDETISPSGKLDLATEDFAMVLSKHNYITLKRPFSHPTNMNVLKAMSNDDLCAHIRDLMSRTGPQETDGPIMIADDCETLSGMTKSIEGSVHKHYNEVAAAAPDSADEALAKRMYDRVRGMTSLATVPYSDFQALGKLLGRYARLRRNCDEGKSPAAQMGVSIVSAKGPSFSKQNHQLSGHACVVAQTLSAAGEAHYAVAEGTSHIMMRNLPPGCPKVVTIPLTEGDKQFDTTEALAVLASNLSNYIKTCGKSRVREYIPYTFEGCDPYVSCPFYQAGFFVGLQMDSLTPGVIPMEQRGAKNAILREVLEGSAVEKPSKPLFGAPVVALGGENVTAMPVNLGKIFGQSEGRELLNALKQRNAETYIGRAEDEVLDRLMTYWGPLEPFDPPGLCCNGDNSWVCSCSESFKNAEVLRGVLEYKTRLARKFNALQAEDPKSDGVTMVVKAHMLSVASHFYVPLPTKDHWPISSARSMQKALAAMPKFWVGLGAEATDMHSGLRRMVVSDQ